MLKRLLIKNFTVFDSLEWFPDRGMCVITGETGSGKSLLVDALMLATGDRVRTGVLRKNTEKCIIEAEFEQDSDPVLPPHVERWNNTLLFRREIHPDGKSRLFLNDSPVTLQDVRNLVTPILEIHSQHAVLQLKNKDFIYRFIDRSCQTLSFYQEQYLPLFLEWEKTEKQKKILEEQQKNLQREKSFLDFQKEEFGILTEDVIYYEKLEQAIAWLEKRHKITESISLVLHLLDGGEHSAYALLTKAQKNLHDISKAVSDKHLDSLHDRLESIVSETRDLAACLEEWGSGLEEFTENPAEIQEKWNAVNRLMYKYKLKSPAELLEEKKRVEEKCALFENIDQEVEDLRKKSERNYQACIHAARQLSSERKKKIPHVEHQILSALSELGMPHARFNMVCEEKKDPDKYGSDTLQIFFSANPGMRPEPLDKIASGGELSRMILAMRYIMGHDEKTPCMILDEIDSGISGQVALQVGKFIRKMAKDKQLFCITHLPQVASQAHHHYRISKMIEDQITRSEIQLLGEEDRVEEIAVMLSHFPPGEHARKNARELLQHS